MLKISLLDANNKARQSGWAKGENWIKSITSIVGFWIKHELKKGEIDLSRPDEADIVLLVFAGALDWLSECSRVMKQHGIEPDASKRNKPYIIAGGAIDSAPFTALKLADVVTVGEAHQFLNMLIKMVNSGDNIDRIKDWAISYPHAIERTQLLEHRRDHKRPWLLEKRPVFIASPDSSVDWYSPPPVRIDDGVVRVVGSKGCWLKCKFCATTYRQNFSKNEDSKSMLRLVKAINNQGDKLQIVTNDIASLPYLSDIPEHGKLAHQSLTVKGVKDKEKLKAILKTGLETARFGVEGISERIRIAFGKPISNDEIASVLDLFHTHKRNSHLFFIVNSPYESDKDWESLKTLYETMAYTINWGICRMKFTSFQPSPPAPLARFIPSMSFTPRIDSLKSWVAKDMNSRHIMKIWPRKEKRNLIDTSDVLQTPKDVLAHLVSDTETIDLAPDLDDAYRLPWEIIEWPMSVERRWRLGEKYKEFMDVKPK